MSLSEDLNNKKEELKSSLNNKTEEIKDSITNKTDEIKDSIAETKAGISESIDSGVKKTKRFTIRLFWGLFILGILAGAGYMFWCNMTYSDGTRTGTLMKVSTKGYVFKTMEGEMNMGGFSNEDDVQVFGNTWKFSVSDKALYDQMVQKQGQKMMLYYKEKNKAMPWQGETNYYVYKVEDK